MTLDELKTVNLKAKCPPQEMTDKMWQEYFESMKLLTSQSKERKMNTSKTVLKVNGRNLESQCTYDGETQWERYCQFINSILRSIRRGECDYCFNIYHITDLLRFEHDRLRTRWMPDSQCFQVWLA